MSFRWERWTLSNLLPVAFVSGIVFIIWWIYTQHHLMYLLQTHIPRDSKKFDPVAYQRGQIEFYISQTLTGMLVSCLLCAIFVDAGSIPDEADWILGSTEKDLDEEISTAGDNCSGGVGATFPLLDADDSGPVPEKGHSDHKESSAPHVEQSQDSSNTNRSLPLVREEKISGGRRFCKWCKKYKPDRCHHCRVCRSCVLRMDHHCPWIANCVGYRNHKYFLLLVFYAVLTTHFIVYTLSESVLRVLVEETTFEVRFQLIFGMTLTSMMALTVTAFLCFHIFLVTHATTTIEFCEKRWSRSDSSGKTQDGGKPRYSMYDMGPMDNARAVLGPRIWLWWLPLDPPDGTGLRFPISFASVATLNKEAVINKALKGDDEQSDSSAGWVKQAAAGEETPECTGATPEWTGARAAAA